MHRFLIACLAIGILAGCSAAAPSSPAPTTIPATTVSSAPTASAVPTQAATASPVSTPTAMPRPVSTPVANLPSWYVTSERPTGPGILSAGSHTTQHFSPGFTFSVPEGWVNTSDEGSYFALFPDSPANQAEFPRSESLAQVLFMGVYPKPWFTCESLETNRGATAAEMLAAASANVVLAVSDPVDVSIGGLTGKQFDVRRNPEWTNACPDDTGLPAGLDPKDERSRVIFLDVPGRGVLVMILYSMSSAEHEAFLTELMPVVESFQFNP
jgi:hypothetical protein